MACLDPSRQILQAEMYEPGRAGLCRGTQTCKTRMDARLPPQNLQPVLGSSVELHPNGTNCYWSKIQ